MNDEATVAEVVEAEDVIVTQAAPLYRRMDTLAIAKRLGVHESAIWNRLQKIKLASER